MKKTYELHRLLVEKTFRFDRLVIQDIDNGPVIARHSPELPDQEICLFHQDVGSGDDYVVMLHDRIKRGLERREPTPVVRFADGEYAFYARSLDCNGLYRQAESAAAIVKSMPMHREALKTLSDQGILAPLVFPGNSCPPRGWPSLFRRSRGDASATLFLEWLYGQGISLRRDNYMPFYAVYAYLTSEEFCRLIDGRKVCILNAECQSQAYRRWFSRFESRPEVVFVEIPAAYVATQWGEMRMDILGAIPPDADICLAGAGVGALLLCADVAARFSIPVIDAGHVLNMMNEREDKSNGPRLYTLRKSPLPLPPPSRGGGEGEGERCIFE